MRLKSFLRINSEIHQKPYITCLGPNTFFVGWCFHSKIEWPLLNFRCGNEAVVLYWERDQTLLIVGRYGQKMSYNYDSSLHLASEIDCIRIITNSQHELLQKVPDVVQQIFRINSTDPGSFLLEASKQFQVF